MSDEKEIGSTKIIKEFTKIICFFYTDTITIESILGTCFDVRVVETTQFGQYSAVIPEVTGSASIVGQNTFYFDPEDPLKDGFLFR